jgi:hypothetical protein
MEFGSGVVMRTKCVLLSVAICYAYEQAKQKSSELCVSALAQDGI